VAGESEAGIGTRSRVLDDRVLGKEILLHGLGKVFCITASGSMVLVPPLTQVGDVLVHIRRGFIPMLLRRKAPGIRRAELVGTCEVLHKSDVYFGSRWENWLLVYKLSTYCT
jgi:hypothetical protein